MTIRDETNPNPRRIRKLLSQGLVGALAGFVASAGIIMFIQSPAVGGLGTSATIAALVAVIYLVIGLGLLLGTATPHLGARFLNVEDADELREQRKILSLSAAAMALWGAALLALALAAPAGPVPQAAALVVGGGGLVAGCVASLMAYRACDELMLAVNLEAGALGYALVLLIAGCWAVIAHLGLAPAPAPLELLTMFYVLVMVASFIAVGRRGMLKIR